MIKSPLEIPNFRNLWLGQLFLSFGQQALFIALTWLVLQKTDSGLAVGIVLMAGGIPMALLSFIYRFTSLITSGSFIC
jgi:hypothetical protein